MLLVPQGFVKASLDTGKPCLGVLAPTVPLLCRNDMLYARLKHDMCFACQGEDYTLGNVDDLDPSEWQVPPECIPIHANVMTYDWSKLSRLTQFDVIMMDPPWQLATANPTRGQPLLLVAVCESV